MPHGPRPKPPPFTDGGFFCALVDSHLVVTECVGRSAIYPKMRAIIDCISSNTHGPKYRALPHLLDLPVHDLFHAPMCSPVETNLRRERQLEGIAKAKAAGVYKGRPPSIEASRVRELKAQGMRPVDIAKALQIGRASVYRVLGQKADH